MNLVTSATDPSVLTQTAQPGGPVLGVFDSGVGGLTVLRELLSHVPEARFVYLGDTARLPYGSKSRETIVRYAVSAARFLLSQGAEMLVIACNTATALALDEIRAAATPIPVVGVVEPGASAAAHATASSGEPDPGVLVLATAATVQSGAYGRTLSHLGIRSVEKPCPLLVPLVEEGWIDHPVTREVARIYLSEALAATDARFSTLLLGCTHYPLLRSVFEQTLKDLGHPLTIVDSAEATARAASELAGTGGATYASRRTPETASGAAHLDDPTDARCRFFATDSASKFRALGSRFLGHPVTQVQHVDLGD